MPNGIILLDKPQGLTSNGALQRVRRAYGAVSAGHVGTLDPMATGMLPLCLDEATKVIGEIESGAKCYEFTVQLGARTNTGDAEGQVVEEHAVPPLDVAIIEGALKKFRGTIQQVPPMYSALKRDGQPLYKLARAGKLPNLTGIGSAYEAPEHADLVLAGAKTPEALADEVLALLKDKAII